MKKINISTIIIILLSGIIVLFNSCEKDDATSDKLNSITIKQSAKDQYFEGDILDLTDLVITFNMENGANKDISFIDFENNGLTCIPQNGTTLTNDITEVTIIHSISETTVILPVTINKIEVSEIEIKTEPLKKDYYDGEVLDLSELEVKLIMNNKETEEVAFTDFANKGLTCSPENGTVLTSEINRVTIKHTVSGITGEQNINVGFTIDIENNSYPIVKIGDQVWMAKNLQTTKYNDGIPITLTEGNSAWTNQTTEAYCWYNNNETTYGAQYGALYNWYAVETGMLCPEGWHVSTDEEWTQLINYVSANGFEGQEAVALKSNITWYGDGDGTDNFGFGALAGGSRFSDGVFHNISYYGTWWTSTESDFNALYRYMFYGSNTVTGTTRYKGVGNSVRCVRD